MAHPTTITIIAILSVSSLYILVSCDSTLGMTFQSFGCWQTINASTSYKLNVNLLFSDFISQSALKGFYNTSVGDSPDTVFGYYMCRGDLKPQDCYSCITNATEFAQDADCEYQDGDFLSGKCIFRYANHSMYRVWERDILSFSPLGTNSSNYPQYNQTLTSTMDALINDAAFGSNNSNGLVPGFATKEVNVRGDEKIYSLAQCTPDIVGVNCSKCLTWALSGPVGYYAGYKGASVKTPKCLLIYNNQSVVDPNKSDNLRPNRVVFYSALFVFMYYMILD